jgi:hypothetical protein
MRAVALGLACISCACQGRRVQTTLEELQFDDHRALSPESAIAMLLWASVPTAGLRDLSRSAAVERRHHHHMMAKGFGKAPAPPPPAPEKRKPMPVQPQAPPMSESEQQKQADLERLQEGGAPEYEVLIREAPEGKDPGQWQVVGVLAVARTGNMDRALATAIFDNEGDLLKGAYQRYPLLKKSDNKMEYGYRVREFPDDPVIQVTKKDRDVSENPLVNWLNAMDNPFNSER